MNYVVLTEVEFLGFEQKHVVKEGLVFLGIYMNFVENIYPLYEGQQLTCCKKNNTSMISQDHSCTSRSFLRGK